MNRFKIIFNNYFKNIKKSNYNCRNSENIKQKYIKKYKDFNFYIKTIITKKYNK